MTTTDRTRLVLLLVALALVGFAAFAYVDNRGRDQRLNADYRAPVANPPIEPDRPDLFEEPIINE